MRGRLARTVVGRLAVALRWRRVLTVGLLAAAVVGYAGTTTASGAGGTSKGGGTATFAESVDGPPLWIFPLYPGTDFTVQYQSQFEYLLVPPLYQFGSGISPAINYKISLAYPPVYKDGDTQVVIKLKHYVWSDGTPVTARDVTFWMNILEAEKNNWAVYVPGLFPDNVTKIQVNGTYELTLFLNKAYSPQFYTDNELAQITPMPQQAWDRESATGPIGNYDETTAGAQAVFTFLDSQSKDLSTYATNPLWKVVDGPWKLQQYQLSGRVVMIPNPSYSGPDKAYLSKIIFLPFDSEVSELDALRAGTLDVGNLPAADAGTRTEMQSRGFTFGQWPVYGFNSLAINFHNPVVGPIFSQLYVRQALERLIDQPVWIQTALAGYGQPDYGPVVNGAPQVTAPIESAAKYPYAFSLSAAKTLLRDHGWSVVPGGVDSCQSPGTAANQCGSGIAKGATLSFNLIYQSASTFEETEMAEYKSDASKVGVQINLTTNVFPFQLAIPCTSTQAACSWQIIDWGGAVYTLPYYPAGGGYFECNGALNYGSYCSQTEVSLDNAAEAPGGNLIPWETYVAKNLPMLWIPNGDFELLEVKNDLKGMLPANPLLAIFPQDWSYTKH
ncbi:MAG: ABC transporter substrate-binding protein [Candidatus Dormiibacterota bacterium]